MMEMSFEHHQSPSEMLLANLQRPRSQQSDIAAATAAVDVAAAGGNGTELDRYLKYMAQQPDNNHNYQQQQQQQQHNAMFAAAGLQPSHHHHQHHQQQQQHHHHLQQQQQQQYNSYYAPSAAVQHLMHQDHHLPHHQQQQQQQQHGLHHGPPSYLLNNGGCGIKSEFGGYASLDGLPPQHYPDVQNVPATANMQSVAAAAAGQVLTGAGGKPDEEFSVILADVRKTCYSS